MSGGERQYWLPLSVAESCYQGASSLVVNRIYGYTSTYISQERQMSRPLNQVVTSVKPQLPFALVESEEGSSVDALPPPAQPPQSPAPLPRRQYERYTARCTASTAIRHAAPKAELFSADPNLRWVPMAVSRPQQLLLLPHQAVSVDGGARLLHSPHCHCYGAAALAAELHHFQVLQ